MKTASKNCINLNCSKNDNFDKNPIDITSNRIEADATMTLEEYFSIRFKESYCGSPSHIATDIFLKPQNFKNTQLTKTPKVLKHRPLNMEPKNLESQDPTSSTPIKSPQILKHKALCNPPKYEQEESSLYISNPLVIYFETKILDYADVLKNKPELPKISSKIIRIFNRREREICRV